MPWPTFIRLTDGRDRLEIDWDDGSRSVLRAATLRQHARSAASERLRLLGMEVPPPPDLTIDGVEAVGNYAVNLRFSDGHDRGIYPWRMLLDLAEP